MKKTLIRVLLIFTGGVAFWGPLVLIEILTRQEFHPLLAIFLPPATFMLGYLSIKYAHVESVRSIALWMLMGVCVLGPWMMTIGASAHGGGFTQMHGWRDWRWLLLSTVVPIYTLAMATYNLTVLAVFGTTAIAALLHSQFERKSRLPGRT